MSLGPANKMQGLVPAECPAYDLANTRGPARIEFALTTQKGDVT